jgi:hypothetical protein
MMLAAVRPDDWNLPLFVHVAGAMLLVGVMVAVAATLVLASRTGGGADTAALARFSFRTLLLGALPAYIVMRGSAEWIASKEDVPDDVDWLGIGYMVSDVGLLLLIVITVLAGLGARRARRPEHDGPVGRVAAGISILLIVMYVVAVWAMTTKPGV